MNIGKIISCSGKCVCAHWPPRRLLVILFIGVVLLLSLPPDFKILCVVCILSKGDHTVCPCNDKIVSVKQSNNLYIKKKIYLSSYTPLCRNPFAAPATVSKPSWQIVRFCRCIRLDGLQYVKGRLTNGTNMITILIWLLFTIIVTVFIKKNDLTGNNFVLMAACTRAGTDSAQFVNKNRTSHFPSHSLECRLNEPFHRQDSTGI